MILQNPELVVLVDEKDNEIGTTTKSEVHTDNTALHRAFSCFVINSKWEILLQQRAASKKTWPLVWSNSVCWHPSPGEKYEDAVVRRLAYELWIYISADKVIKISDYRYCFTRYWVMENEFCPIFLVYSDDLPNANLEEVESTIYMPRVEWLSELQNDLPWDQWKWSERCKEEALLVDNWLKTNKSDNKII